MSLTPELKSLRAQAAVHKSWANTENRTARTAKARAAAERRFEDEVDPERKLQPAVRAKRAASARKAYFAQLAYKSAKARAARKAVGGGDAA